MAVRGLVSIDDKPITWAYIYYPSYPMQGYKDSAVLVVKTENAPSRKGKIDKFEAHTVSWAQNIIKNYIKVKDE